MDQRLPVYISLAGSYVPISGITFEYINGVRSMIIGSAEDDIDNIDNNDNNDNVVHNDNVIFSAYDTDGDVNMY